ncbi:MAG: AEC family transporter [Methyloligellaceae bacterium]
MLHILYTLIPIFLIGLFGYIAVKTDRISADGIGAISKFVFFFALPALLFSGMVRQPIGEVIALDFIWAYSFSIISLFVAAAFLARLIWHYAPAESSMIACVGSLPNLGLMGIPALVLIMGDKVLVPLTVMWLIDMIVILPLTILIIEYDKAPGNLLHKVGESIRQSLFANPVVAAAVIGALLATLGFQIPQALDNSIRFLGNSAGPAALFALGGMLASQSFNWDDRLSHTMVFLKLIVQPFLTYMAMTLFGIDGELRLIATMGSAIPVAVLSFLVAQTHNILIPSVSSSTVISTLLSVLTLTAILALLGQ